MLSWIGYDTTRPATLRSGRAYPFNCCGADYRKRTRVNDHFMLNKKGIMVVQGQVGVEGDINGHEIKHVHTRFGTLTVSVRKTHNAPRNLLQQPV